VTARLRTVLPTAGTAGGLPVVSASDSRVYFLDGDTDVRFLDRDGSQGSAAHVAGGVHVESAFAVSPDDRRIAVATFDTSADPATMRLSVEDLAGGADRRDLPAPTDAAMWPIGWRAGALVLALGSAPTRNVADNPYGTFAGYSLVDAETGLRLAGIDCDPTGTLTPAGTACLGGTSTLAVADFSNRVRGLESAAGGSSIVSAAESPDGARVAYCCATGQLQLWDLGTGSVRGLGAAGGQSFGWVDGTRLLVADPSGQRGRLVDVTTGAAVPVAASGRVVGRLPGDL
jgi:WD40 repeat protein